VLNSEGLGGVFRSFITRFIREVGELCDIFPGTGVSGAFFTMFFSRMRCKWHHDAKCIFSNTEIKFSTKLFFIFAYYHIPIA